MALREIKYAFEYSILEGSPKGSFNTVHGFVGSKINTSVLMK